MAQLASSTNPGMGLHMRFTLHVVSSILFLNVVFHDSNVTQWCGNFFLSLLLLRQGLKETRLASNLLCLRMTLNSWPSCFLPQALGLRNMFPVGPGRASEQAASLHSLSFGLLQRSPTAQSQLSGHSGLWVPECQSWVSIKQGLFPISRAQPGIPRVFSSAQLHGGFMEQLLPSWVH